MVPWVSATVLGLEHEMKPAHSLLELVLLTVTGAPVRYTRVCKARLLGSGGSEWFCWGGNGRLYRDD